MQAKKNRQSISLKKEKERYVMNTMSDIEFKRAKEGILKIISKYSNMTKED